MDIETNKIKSPFTVPEGYFSELEDRILSEVSVRTLTEELPFIAPEGYFESFEERILGTLKTEEFPKEQPFKASEDYFSEMENQILGKISLEKINKKEAFQIPSDDYFAKMEADILQKTVGKKQSPFLEVFRNKKIFRYAASAIIVGGLGFGFYKYQEKPADQFAQISSEEMVAYLADQPLTDADLELIVTEGGDLNIAATPVPEAVSEKEILKYLEENDI